MNARVNAGWTPGERRMNAGWTPGEPGERRVNRVNAVTVFTANYFLPTQRIKSLGVGGVSFKKVLPL